MKLNPTFPSKHQHKHELIVTNSISKVILSSEAKPQPQGFLFQLSSERGTSTSTSITTTRRYFT